MHAVPANRQMVERRITILDLRDSPWVDGPGRSTLETASRINHEKYRIIVADYSGGTQKTDDYLNEAKRRGLSVVRIRETGALDFNVIRQVLCLIDTHGIDIVHTHDFRSDVIGLFCARRRKIPVVATCHGWIANNLKGKVRVVLDRLALYFFDHIVVVSKKLQTQLHSQGIRNSKITALPNAVAFENFIRDSSGSFRNELGVQSNTVLVANIGRLSPEKGQTEFLYAASAVLKHYVDIRFILIGVGPDQPKLDKLAKDLGISDQVIFCGYRADMSRIYSSLDLVVQSSSTEGMPNVVLEAAAMEVPVIATDVGGTAEIIEHGVSGMLVKPGLPGEIDTVIQDFLQDRERYRDMARRARQSVRNRFSYESRTNSLMRIYSTLHTTKKCQ